ncbi:MAG: SDR family oxidoreductase [Acidobacteriota bacterium]
MSASSNTSPLSGQPLAGRRALVTGGSSGIGEGIARALLQAGARVAITGRRQEQLERAAESLRAAATNGHENPVIALQGDVAQPEAAARVVAEAAEALGGLDVLVNNAGIARGGPVEAMSEEDVHAVVDIDLKGPIWITRAALPHLAEAGSSAIINISSSVTFQAPPNFSVYTAAKAGLEALTRCWALDFAKQGVRVNAISPGVVDTPIFETMMPADQVRGALDHFATNTPLGRVGRPTDVAALTVFFASPAAAWITGAIVPVDGGLSAGG